MTCAQAHHAQVFANRRGDRLKVLVFDGVGMWLCTRRLQAGNFEWPREDTGSLSPTSIDCGVKNFGVKLAFIRRSAYFHTRRCVCSKEF